MPSSDTNGEALKRLHKTVKAFLSRQDSSPFQEPVDWRGLGLTDYPEIIQNMMDLGTIKRKLERDQYQTFHECAADIRLVWSNCMTYNSENSDFWLLAKAYSKRFEEKYRKIKSEFNLSEDESEEEEVEEEPEDEEEEESETEATSQDLATTNAASSSKSSAAAPTTLDTKARLAANLLLLNGPEWAHIVTTVELESPKSLVEVGAPGYVELNLDEMDPKVFLSISNYAEEKASARKRPGADVAINDITGKKKRRK